MVSALTKNKFSNLVEQRATYAMYSVTSKTSLRPSLGIFIAGLDPEMCKLNHSPSQNAWKLLLYVCHLGFQNGHHRSSQ